jgi:Arc/MetJ-type ribon-helix-helix transcriptional regulator
MTTPDRTAKIKVTHTLTRGTHHRMRELVERGEARDVSAFIEQAVLQALDAQKMRTLQLELEAFDDLAYTSELARFGNVGFEDLATELARRG